MAAHRAVTSGAHVFVLALALTAGVLIKQGRKAYPAFAAYPQQSFAAHLDLVGFSSKPMNERLALLATRARSSRRRLQGGGFASI
jgi:hypothetical protein